MSNLVAIGIVSLSLSTSIGVYTLWRNRSLVQENFSWFVGLIGVSIGIASVCHFVHADKISHAHTAILLTSGAIALALSGYFIFSSLQNCLLKFGLTSAYFGFIFFLHCSLSGGKVDDRVAHIFTNKAVSIPLGIIFFAAFAYLAKQCDFSNAIISSAFFIPFRWPALLGIVHTFKLIKYKLSGDKDATEPKFTIAQHYSGSVLDCMLSVSQFAMVVCCNFRASFIALKNFSQQVFALLAEHLYKLKPESEYLANLVLHNQFNGGEFLAASKNIVTVYNNIMLNVGLFFFCKKFVCALDSVDSGAEGPIMSTGDVILLILATISIGSDMLWVNRA